MPLTAPELDDLTYEEIVRRLRLRIPRYAPEWTDVNDSDPGMTLLQLFAWLTDLLIHRINKVPRRSYIKFLQLLNLELEPAQPAVAHLTFEAEPGQTGPPPTLRAGAQASAQSPTGEPLIFETDDDLDLIRLPLTDVQVFDGAAFQVLTAANEPGGDAFYPFGWTPQPNSALYLGFDPGQAPTQQPFPPQMRFRVFRPLATEAVRPQLCSGDPPRPQPPVRLVWEYRHADDPLVPPRWRRLSTIDDESVAFTREGYIMVEGPMKSASTREGRQAEPRHWLRCRLEQGSYPPGQTPQIDFIRPNTVRARNLTTVRDELIGISAGLADDQTGIGVGRPDQQFTLRHTPVEPGSLVLSVELPGQEPEIWRRVDDFLGSGPRDKHFVLNHNSGVLHFGNGRRGEIPVAGAALLATRYRYGGGTAGNVGAGEINAPAGNLVGVSAITNARPAEGGRDEQALEDLMEEAPGRLRCLDRAVTVEDYEALAVEAGGVARARAIAGMHPDYPGVTVPGAVTVLIVPASLAMPPVPSPDLLATTCAYLDRRRTLTTELYVGGPRYFAVSIEATITARPNVSFRRVSEEVQASLNAFLDPLGQISDAPAATDGEGDTEQQARGAASRRGWPFGQDLHPTRLYSVILSVSDVVSVSALTLRVDGKPHDKLTEPVTLTPDALVYGRDHEIKVEPAVDR